MNGLGRHLTVGLGKIEDDFPFRAGNLPFLMVVERRIFYRVRQAFFGISKLFHPSICPGRETVEKLPDTLSSFRRLCSDET